MVLGRVKHDAYKFKMINYKLQIKKSVPSFLSVYSIFHLSLLTFNF